MVARQTQGSFGFFLKVLPIWWGNASINWHTSHVATKLLCFCLILAFEEIQHVFSKLFTIGLLKEVACSLNNLGKKLKQVKFFLPTQTLLFPLREGSVSRRLCLAHESLGPWRQRKITQYSALAKELPASQKDDQRQPGSRISPCAEHDQGRLGPLGETLLGLHHVRTHWVIPVPFIIAKGSFYESIDPSLAKPYLIMGTRRGHLAAPAL